MTISRTLLAAMSVTALSCLLMGYAQNAPDNTRQNKTQSPTADKQSEDKSDRMITADIRKALMADKGLSTYAHNVKIITSNGQVVLKGPVKSEAEKNQVYTDAISAGGSAKITNQLTIKP